MKRRSWILTVVAIAVIAGCATVPQEGGQTEFLVGAWVNPDYEDMLLATRWMIMEVSEDLKCAIRSTPDGDPTSFRLEVLESWASRSGEIYLTANWFSSMGTGNMLFRSAQGTDTLELVIGWNLEPPSQEDLTPNNPNYRVYTRM